MRNVRALMPRHDNGRKARPTRQTREHYRSSNGIFKRKPAKCGQGNDYARPFVPRNRFGIVALFLR